MGLALPAARSCSPYVMGIVYGAFLAFLIPQFPAWMLLTLSAGVFASGIRDLIASNRSAAA